MTLLRLLASLCTLEEEAGAPTPFPVLHGLSFFGHTHIDDSQPLQREYSVMGLRAVCQQEAVREALTELKGMEVEGGEQWKERGVDVQWDEERERVRVGSARPSSMKRTSGPIDWGPTEPFTDDDFM